MLSKDDERMVKWVVRMRAQNLFRTPEALGRLREVVNADNLAEVLPLLPEHLARSLQDSLVQHPVPLKGIGYWQAALVNRRDENDPFPNPLFLVCPDWCTGERKEILAYLRAGWTYAQWRGKSYCRFNRCGIPARQREMGSRCLTDGEWVWPEGLPHYVEHHQVRLPDEFLASMRRNEWQVPDRSGQVTRTTLGEPDVTFWIAWGSARRG